MSAESEAERQSQMKTGAIPKTPRINLQVRTICYSLSSHQFVEGNRSDSSLECFSLALMSVFVHSNPPPWNAAAFRFPTLATVGRAVHNEVSSGRSEPSNRASAAKSKLSMRELLVVSNGLLLNKSLKTLKPLGLRSKHRHKSLLLPRQRSNVSMNYERRFYND